MSRLVYTPVLSRFPLTSRSWQHDNFVVAKDVKETAKKYARHFDLLICTAFNADMPIESLYLKMLAPEGTLVLCGLPEEGLPSMMAQAFVGKGVSLAGSLIAGGSRFLLFLFLPRLTSTPNIQEPRKLARCFFSPLRRVSRPGPKFAPCRKLLKRSKTWMPELLATDSCSRTRMGATP